MQLTSSCRLCRSLSAAGRRVLSIESFGAFQGKHTLQRASTRAQALPRVQLCTCGCARQHQRPHTLRKHPHLHAPRVLTRIHVLSFLSGLAECRLGLNDVLVKGNEVVSRQDIVPTTTTKWIRLHECRFHGCVDEDVFRGSRVILFNPLDACRFELMRFRTVFAEKTLPFTLRTAASIHGAEVEVQSWLRMSAGFSSNWDPLTQVPCENVMVRYPVPSEWVKNFRRDA